MQKCASVFLVDDRKAENNSNTSWISNKGSNLASCMRFFQLRSYTVCKSLDRGNYEITILLLHDIAKIQEIATKEYAA